QEFVMLSSPKGAFDLLRQTIVELGLAGKLVKHDQHDAPVEELLTRIEAERVAAIASGVHKPAKGLQPPPSRNDLPPGWVEVRLADLLVFGPRNGLSPKGVDFETPVKVLTLSATTTGSFRPEHFKFAQLKVEAD